MSNTFKVLGDLEGKISVASLREKNVTSTKGAGSVLVLSNE